VRRTLILPLLLVAFASGGVLYLTTSGRDGSTGRPHPRHPALPASPTASPARTYGKSPLPTPSSVPTREDSATLTYLRGTSIVTRILGSEVEHVVVDLHTADVAASPRSGWIAYVAPRGSASGEGDFVRRPELRLLDLPSGAQQDAGVGFSPLWRADGSELAFLAPNRPRSCDAESCTGGVRVMIGAPGQPSRPLTGYGHLHLLAWAGDRVLVSDDSDLSRTTSLSVDGSPAFSIPVPPSEIWDASPDGSLLLTVTPDGSSFTRLSRGHLARSAGTFHGPHAILGDGSWSAGSGRLVAVVRTAAGKARLGFVTPLRGVVPISGTQGAMGNVVWDRGGDSFAFVAVDGNDSNRLRAVLCRSLTREGASCRPWFSWRQGVSLLQLTSP
jgi:hypothetical protein